MLTAVAEVAGKAPAESGLVVAHASARAVPTRLIAEAVKRIRTRRTLLFIARWTAIADVTKTADGLHGVPRLIIDASRLVRQDALGEARAAIVAVVWTHRALTGNAIISKEAVADAS